MGWSRWLLCAIALSAPAATAISSPDEPVRIDFHAPHAVAWHAVNDGVMGGISTSRLQITDQGTGLFQGRVSLENNGGFASVRASVGTWDLSSFTGMALRVSGDGQQYRLRLHTDDRFDSVAYQAGFVTRGDGWEIVRLPFSAFVATFRGRRPAAATPLDPGSIRQIGLMIADQQAGAFHLEIDWLQPYREHATSP